MATGRHKLSAKIVGILALFFMVAVATIAMTLHLSWQLEGAAAAINDAGSERMRSYRIGYLLSRAASDAPEQRDRSRDVRAEMALFEHVLFDLENGNPARPLFVPRDAAIQHDVGYLKQAWFERMKPLISGMLDRPPAVERDRLHKLYDEEVVRFVETINGFVLKMEQSYAYKTTLLRMFQLALVALAVVGTGILMRFFFALVIRPVAILQQGIGRMASADFSVRLPVTGSDEFGELAHGFNQMAGHLQDLYATLEQRVEAETASLADKNRELALLYGITAFLSEPSTLDEICRGFLARVKEALGASGGAIRLFDNKSQKLIMTVHEGLSESFLQREMVLECGECFCGEAAAQNTAPCVFDPERPPKELVLHSCRREGFRTASVFNISYNKRVLGIFNLYFREARQFSDQKIHFIETLCQHLGVTVENQLLRSREKQIAINEERNLLAQELHDSIAQGLAFLNLQAQMLDASLRASKLDEALGVAQMIQEGVQESYDDVRELLTHFRTRVVHADLPTAIGQALKKLEEQTGIQTFYDRRGACSFLSPETEAQILHIVQEALSNIRKHARANKVHVIQEEDGERFRISVRDDGIGFDSAGSVVAGNDNHIGLKIISERAGRIGGRCQVHSRRGGGTEVEFVLPRSQKEAA